MSDEIKTLEINAVYDADTKRTHRYLIKGDIEGSLYIPKGADIPDKIILSLKVGKEVN